MVSPVVEGRDVIKVDRTLNELTPRSQQGLVPVSVPDIRQSPGLRTGRASQRRSAGLRRLNRIRVVVASRRAERPRHATDGGA